MTWSPWFTRVKRTYQPIFEQSVFSDAWAAVLVLHIQHNTSHGTCYTSNIRQVTCSMKSCQTCSMTSWNIQHNTSHDFMEHGTCHGTCLIWHVTYVIEHFFSDTSYTCVRENMFYDTELCQRKHVLRHRSCVGENMFCDIVCLSYACVRENTFYDMVTPIYICKENTPNTVRIIWACQKLKRNSDILHMCIYVREHVLIHVPHIYRNMYKPGKKLAYPFVCMKLPSWFLNPKP